MNEATLRQLAGIGAVTGALSLALQLTLTIRLALAQGGSVLGGVWIYLDYFTILTNALATVALGLMARGSRTGVLTRTSGITAITACMLIVGAVYNTLLRGLWQPTGWQRLADEWLHVVMPLLCLACWWLATAGAALRWRALLPWLLYPLGYLAYALARGEVDGRYPYPFLDVAALGMPRVLANATAVALAFVAVGAALAAVVRWRTRRTGEPLSRSAGRR